MTPAGEVAKVHEVPVETVRAAVTSEEQLRSLAAVSPVSTGCFANETALAFGQVPDAGHGTDDGDAGVAVGDGPSAAGARLPPVLRPPYPSSALAMTTRCTWLVPS
jgi:hypothetical protein